MQYHPTLDIDDCTEAIGVEPEVDYDDFGDVIEFCDKSPSGQCEYTLLNPRCCKHCGHGGGA